MLGLNFKGSWRQYQKQVLDRFQDYQADGHVHLVAAPGSGKTTIGIELIARFGNPALILVPTVTIREQWVDRIQTAFLEDGQRPRFPKLKGDEGINDCDLSGFS